MLHHNPPKAGFLQRGIGEHSLFGQTPAGKEEQVCVKLANEIFRIIPHVGNGLIQQRAAGTKGTDIPFRQHDGDLRAVGDYHQIPKLLQVLYHTLYRGGSIQKKNLSILDMPQCLPGDLLLGFQRLRLPQFQRHFVSNQIVDGRATEGTAI